MKQLTPSLLTTTCLTAALLCFAPVLAVANPVGGSVTAGSATISSSGNTLSVNQQSDRTVIDWRGFDIGTGETTQFYQPSSSSIAVNRVNSNSASQINGNLNANGNVVIINQNGVLFGAGSRVDVNSIVATTADINNTQFMSGGNLAFTTPGNPNASIINNGTITAKQAGLVGFVAPNVINNGVINAKLGRVQLASGDTATVDMYGDNLMEVAVSDAVTSQLVANNGIIRANGGKIALTAAAGGQIVNSLITNSGILKAQTVGRHKGEIIIAADGSNAVAGNVAANKGKKQGVSTVLVGGIVDVSGKKAGQTGGYITITGDDIGILSNAHIDASGNAGGGSIQIGGDFHGQGTTATAIDTIVQQGAVIDASAITSGNGGSIAVWSDINTDFGGDIITRAGTLSGNGGYVETSGKETLSVSGAVDSSAINGNAGTWLLDPNNITIQSTGSNTNVSATPNFTSTNNNAIVTTTSIQNALNGGTSVLITTASAGSNSQLGDITVNNSILKNAGGDATLTLKAANSIILASNSTISSTNNKLNILLDADSDASGAGAIVLNSGSGLSSNGGYITLGGGANPLTTAAVGADSTNKVGIKLNGASISSGAGDISLYGKGIAGTTSDFGIYLTGGSTIQSTTGKITLNGTGGAGTNTDYGVDIATGTNQITSTSGDISITGYGGGGTTGNNNYGVNAVGETIQTGGNGKITITGTAGNGSGGTNRGAFIGGTITTSAGDLIIKGYGGGTGGQNIGTYLAAASLNTTNGGTINITGNGTTTADTGASDYGIYLYNSSILQAATTGGISLTGNGGAGTGTDYGIYSSTGNSQLTTADGTITLLGNGKGSGSSNAGIRLDNATVTASGLGAINFTGYGSSDTSAVTNNYGIYLYNGSTVQTNSHDISLIGHGGAGTDTNYGVYTATGTNNILSTTGNIGITGYGGSGTGVSNYGDYLSVANITTGGSGGITIAGTGGNTNGGSNRGIFSSSSTTTVDGNIIFNGYGNGTGDGNLGTSFSGANINATGSGAITINGNGTTLADAAGSASDYGIDIYNGTQIQSHTGNIIFNASATSGTASQDFYAYTNTGVSDNLIGGTAQAGNITLNADTVSLANIGFKTISSKTVYFTPKTASTTIGLGTATAQYNIATSVLGDILAGNLIIGRTDGTGSITATGTNNWTATNTTLQSGSGAITLGDTNTFTSNTLNVTTSNGGDISLGAINAKTIFARTLGTIAGNIILNGVENATGTGTAITLVSGKNLINNAGNALSATNGRWLAYSANATGTTGEENLNANFDRYGCTYTGGCATGVTVPGTGNGLIYSYTPVLNVTTNNFALTYGDAVPVVTNYGYTLSGYNANEFADTVTGSLNGSTNYSAGSNVGTYHINYANGSLSSAEGYSFNYLNNSSAITVGKKSLTVSANPVNIFVNDTPNFSVNYSGFVLGQNQSVLSSLASISTNAPNYLTSGFYTIMPYGVTAQNYSIQYTPSILSINALPSTVIAAAQTPVSASFTSNSSSSSSPAQTFSAAAPSSTSSTTSDTSSGSAQTTDSTNAPTTKPQMNAGYTINSGVQPAGTILHGMLEIEPHLATNLGLTMDTIPK